MATRVTVIGRAVWRRLGVSFLVMAAGLATGVVGLAWDFYNHVIVGLSPATESLLAPAHLMIFGAIPLTGLGFVMALRALAREGHSPFRALAG